MSEISKRVGASCGLSSDNIFNKNYGCSPEASHCWVFILTLFVHRLITGCHFRNDPTVLHDVLSDFLEDMSDLMATNLQ